MTEVDNILHGIAKQTDTPAKGHSRHGDPTANRGISLADGSPKMKRASKWLSAISATHKFFVGAPEARIINAYYGKGIKIKDVALALDIDRRTIQKMRDNIVFRCALHAIARGLIVLPDESDQGTSGRAGGWNE